jgi:hypothetical protein
LAAVVESLHCAINIVRESVAHESEGV